MADAEGGEDGGDGGAREQGALRSGALRALMRLGDRALRL